MPQQTTGLTSITTFDFSDVVLAPFPYTHLPATSGEILLSLLCVLCDYPDSKADSELVVLFLDPEIPRHQFFPGCQDSLVRLGVIPEPVQQRGSK